MASSSRAIDERKSMHERSRSACSGRHLRNRPLPAATNTSSIPWATRTAGSRPTIRAAAFERMSGPHQRLDRPRRALQFLHRKHAGRENGRLALGFQPEQFEHRESAQVVGHGRGVLSARHPGPQAVEDSLLRRAGSPVDPAA